MKIKSQYPLMVILTAGVLSACSQQQTVSALPEPVVEKPIVVAKPVPVPQPYQDVVVKPAPLKPAPLPTPVAKPPQPTMVVKPAPLPVIPPPKQVVVPKVKVKGNYRGAVQIDERLRQQYQQ